MNKIELLEELRNLDEVTLLELLNVSANDLVDAFLDRIDENQSKLVKAVYDQQT
jgi:predicted component of type VI protein secretion system